MVIIQKTNKTNQLPAFISLEILLGKYKHLKTFEETGIWNLVQTTTTVFHLQQRKKLLVSFLLQSLVTVLSLHTCKCSKHSTQIIQKLKTYSCAVTRYFPCILHRKLKCYCLLQLLHRFFFHFFKNTRSSLTRDQAGSTRAIPENAFPIIFISELSVKINEFSSLVDKYLFLKEAWGVSCSSASKRQVDPCTQSNQWTPHSDRASSTTVNLYSNSPDSWSTNINMVSYQPEQSGNC